MVVIRVVRELPSRSIKFRFIEDPRDRVRIEAELYYLQPLERVEPRSRRQTHVTREAATEIHGREITGKFEDADEVIPPTVVVKSRCAPCHMVDLTIFGWVNSETVQKEQELLREDPIPRRYEIAASCAIAGT